MGRALATAMVVAAGLCVGCNEDNDLPASFISGLRVLAIQAEPAQVDPGGTTQLTVLAVDTNARAIDVSWSRCLLPPLPGTAVNPACVTSPAAPDLVPIGSGLMLGAEMPADAPGTLGQPDATNGVYLPLVARATAGDAAVEAVYRLRLGDGTPPNLNPTVARIDVLDTASVPTPLEEAAPLVVHAGDVLTLAATAAPGDAQTYVAVGGTMETELIRFSWFCTAGALDSDRTSEEEPTNTLTLEENLPGSGENIDLYVVAHDGRGGVGYTHRSLVLQ